MPEQILQNLSLMSYIWILYYYCLKMMMRMWMEMPEQILQNLSLMTLINYYCLKLNYLKMMNQNLRKNNLRKIEQNLKMLKQNLMRMKQNQRPKHNLMSLNLMSYIWILYYYCLMMMMRMWMEMPEQILQNLSLMTLINYYCLKLNYL